MAAKVLQHRRGTTTQHSSFVGEIGEFTYNTDTHSIHVHDGVTAGGHEIMTKERADALYVGSGGKVPSISGAPIYVSATPTNNATYTYTMTTDAFVTMSCTSGCARSIVTHSGGDNYDDWTEDEYYGNTVLKVDVDDLNIKPSTTVKKESQSFSARFFALKGQAIKVFCNRTDRGSSDIPHSFSATIYPHA